jgi:hypothetical protein
MTWGGSRAHRMRISRYHHQLGRCFTTRFRVITVFLFSLKNLPMAFEAIVSQVGVYRVFLEERAEGVYVNVFEAQDSGEPIKDWLAPHFEGAKLLGKEEYGIQEADWKQVPNEPWHAPEKES